MNYPKATCDPGTVALRLANERADRWKQRHDALAARLASVKTWFDALENLQRAYADIVMDTPEERETHRKLTVLAALGLHEARAVLGSDARPPSDTTIPVRGAEQHTTQEADK